MGKSFLDWQERFHNRHWDKTRSNSARKTNNYSFFQSKAAKKKIREWKKKLLQELEESNSKQSEG